MEGRQGALRRAYPQCLHRSFFDRINDCEEALDFDGDAGCEARISASSFLSFYK